MIGLVEVCYRVDLAEEGWWCPAHSAFCLIRIPVHQVALTAEGVTDLGEVAVVWLHDDLEA